MEKCREVLEFWTFGRVHRSPSWSYLELAPVLLDTEQEVFRWPRDGGGRMGRRNELTVKLGGHGGGRREQAAGAGAALECSGASVRWWLRVLRGKSPEALSRELGVELPGSSTLVSARSD